MNGVRREFTPTGRWHAPTSIDRGDRRLDEVRTLASRERYATTQLIACLAEIFDRALTLLVTELEKTKR